MITATYDAVAIRAYHIWEGEGRPHGRHEDHWFAALAAEVSHADEARAVAQQAIEAAPAKTRAPAKAKAPAKARKSAPKAPAEAVVAAAALAAPRTARTGAKGARAAH